MLKRKPVGATSTQKEVVPTENVTLVYPQSTGSQPVQNALEHQQCPLPEVAVERPHEKGGWVISKRKFTLWALIGMAVLLATVGIVVGVVIGMKEERRGSGSEEGSESVSGDESQPGDLPSALPTSTDEATTSSASNPDSSRSSRPEDTDSLLDPEEVPSVLRLGATYNASFTVYGTGDGGSGANCSSTRDIACGFYSRPGFTAAVSEFLYQGSSSEYGDACGTCWLLETEETSSRSSFEHSVVVVVNDLCMGSSTGKDMCGQKSIDDLNDYDAQVNFNLCFDSGAAETLFNWDVDIGLALGSATRVRCQDEWQGRVTEDP